VVERNSACKRNRAKVFALVEEGASLSAIGRKVGTNKHRVKEFLLRNGITKKFGKGSPREKNPNWKGGRILTYEGYVKLSVPGRGYVLEHRFVMEQALGRRLLPLEVVHHRNCNRSDNRLSNLILFSENGKHLAHELQGRCPNWSLQGKANIQAAVEKWRESRRERKRRLGLNKDAPPSL
jgi:hypothetical protein